MADQAPRSYYSLRSEIDGSDELAVALGEGWEPFAAFPSTALDEYNYEVAIVVVYLRRRE